MYRGSRVPYISGSVIDLPHMTVNIKNNSTFNREAGDVLHPLRACLEVVLMSTYEELNLIISIALLIVAILNFTHKK